MQHFAPSLSTFIVKVIGTKCLYSLFELDHGANLKWYEYYNHSGDTIIVFASYQDGQFYAIEIDVDSAMIKKINDDNKPINFNEDFYDYKSNTLVLNTYSNSFIAIGISSNNNYVYIDNKEKFDFDKTFCWFYDFKEQDLYVLGRNKETKLKKSKCLL